MQSAGLRAQGLVKLIKGNCDTSNKIDKVNTFNKANTFNKFNK